MKTNQTSRSRIAVVVAMLLASLSAFGQGGGTLANPHWNITLTDYSYSDFLLDNTPGFEGREYLSGEWGAAVGYQVAGGPNVTAQWLEPNFLYPDWPTNSTFSVITPLSTPTLNADGLPVAESVIANDHLQITQRFEMLDTVTGTPMGTTPASAAGAGTALSSNRYVLKHTYTIKNIAGAAISNVNLFQLLHGVQSERGLYDNRVYPGPLGNFRYDTTLAGVSADGLGGGLEDYLTFQSTVAPTALEIGYYGIEGNGVDNHGTGKPTDGVHRSIEANWLTAPYDTRQGTDSFVPPQRWVSGAQRWTLGNLAAGQSVSFDVVLSILTGSLVPPGNSIGSCDGGSHVPGGIDYDFESVETEGTCFSDFARADQEELAVRIAQGEFAAFTFQTPSQPAQLWDVSFNGTYTGAINVTFGFDPTLLPAGFDETELAVYHFSGGAWAKLPGTVDPLAHSIAVSTTTLGAFALGAASLTNHIIAASAAPSNSGVITGAGSYVAGSSVTLTAAANAGYFFTNWTENAEVVSASPTFTFLAGADRTLVANFTAVGTGKVIATASTPTAGGTTSGDGEYALNTNATVSATANPGYKFSKWLINGATVSSAKNYTFPVTGNLTLVAKFKPVYYVTIAAEPPEGGEPEGDPFYEMGELAKLKAKPLPGWSLVSWTQNGVVVSTDENFSFNVSGNRDLVASYALGSRIDLLADPKTAGKVSGAGVFEATNPVTVSAEPLPGYIFLEWTENGDPVSTTADYTFTSDKPRLLTARFITLPKITMATAAEPGKQVVSWPDAPGWVLQESAELATWATTTRAITTLNGQRSVTVDASAGKVFFRLKYQ
jgi:hypothetical protein